MNKIKCKPILISFIFLWTSLLSSLASPQNYFTVGGVNIIIPPPMHGMVETGSENRTKMEAFVPQSNRLICAFLTKEQNDALSSDSIEKLNNYAFVEVSRKSEYYDCSQKEFSKIIAGAGTDLKHIAESSFKECQDQVNNRLKALDMDSIQIGETRQLGSLFSTTNAFNFCLLSTMQHGEQNIRMAVSTVITMVKSRILFLYVFKEYEGPKTINWLGPISERWTKDISELNKQ